MQSEALKPCPFCGGNNLRFRLSDIEGWIAHVECTDCDDMLGPMSEWKHDEKEDAEKDAAAVWNKRAALEAALSAAEPVFMDDEDRTPMPPGFDDALWRKADEVHHAMALVARDQECVKILYAALSAPSVAVKALDKCAADLLLYNLLKEAIQEGMDKATNPDWVTKDFTQSEAYIAIRAALSAQVQDVAGWQPPQDCDGKEQLAFETWAAHNRYDMHEHPLHYLFMDAKTNAARQGWKAGLQYVRDRFAAPAKQEG